MRNCRTYDNQGPAITFIWALKYNKLKVFDQTKFASTQFAPVAVTSITFRVSSLGEMSKLSDGLSD